ncbi:MAG: DUF3488 domain-containing protein [Calothrix sp. SM1_5_4]|nr:DUF3488 domain-containing protein [Calothrix sp. SM1_5_4]
MSGAHALQGLTFPLLALVVFNLLPALYLRPLWSVIFCAVVLSYRAWLHLVGHRMPPRWVMIGGQILVCGLIWQQYFSFFGDEAAGTFLMLLTALKTYELRNERDYFVTTLLCFLVLMSYLLIDQSLLLTFFLLLDVGLLLAFLFALEEERWDWKAGWAGALPVLCPALILSAKSLPLMALIFVLFPRFSTGFGAGGPVQGKIGVTDQLRPGSVSKLIPSDELVFRATFPDA